MAISAFSLETTGVNTDLAAYSTTSQSPTANRLQLLWVYSIAASTPNIPTVTGGGLTWVQVDTQDGSASLRRITLFRAMGNSPVPGALTIDFGGQTQTGCAWSWVEYMGVNTGGTNGSGAIVQAVTNATAGTATSLTVTLASFASADNATVGGFGIPLNTASQPTVGSGFTSTGQRNQNNPNLSIASEFKASSDTTVGMSSGVASIPWVGIAVELNAASPISVTPQVNTLSLLAFNPLLPVSITPDLLPLETTAFAPVIGTTDNILVTPGVTTLDVLLLDPSVQATNDKFANTTAATLAVTLYAPTVIAPHMATDSVVVSTLEDTVVVSGTQQSIFVRSASDSLAITTTTDEIIIIANSGDIAVSNAGDNIAVKSFEDTITVA